MRGINSCILCFIIGRFQTGQYATDLKPVGHNYPQRKEEADFQRVSILNTTSFRNLH